MRAAQARGVSMKNPDSADALIREYVAAWNRGEANLTTIETLFGQGGNGYPQPSGDLDLILAIGTREWIPRDEPVPSLSKGRYKQLKAVVQSAPHSRSQDRQDELKIFALEWLVQRGARSPTVETEYVGGRCDVMAPDLGCVVECGNTRIDKLFATAVRLEWREFALLPYSSSNIVVFDFSMVPFARIRAIAHESRITIRKFITLVLGENSASDSVLRTVHRSYPVRWRRAAALSRPP